MKNLFNCFVLSLVLFLLANPSASAQEEELSWRAAQRQESSWYGSEEAQRIAENVILYQNDNGGWPKNLDMAKRLEEAQVKELQEAKSKDVQTGIDNGATFSQIKFLAKVYDAVGKETYKESFLRGLDFLLEAQYDNGGWPQFYPVRQGYYENITFNDDAMMGVMVLLRDIAKGNEPYDFVDRNRRANAKRAIEKGLDMILKSQVEVDGELTIWCAQHDKNDLKPAKARAYELPSLSGKESVKIVEYLMELENPGPAVKQSIHSAIDWYKENKITGMKVVWVKADSLPGGKDRILVEDPASGPLWARFYELGTSRPMFVGRDGEIKTKLSEIEHERRINYSYIGNYAEKLLQQDYPEWKEKN